MILFRPGTRVRELAAPHRAGTVRFVSRTGPYATIWVALDGFTIAAFPPSGLTLL